MQASVIAALRLLMLTGCRMGKILSLRWDDVDRTAGVFRLRDGKTGPRMVPLTRPVLAVLDGIERIEGVPWVIRNKSNGRLTGLFSHWRGIREEAGLDNVCVHDLRHTFASRALALGESLQFMASSTQRGTVYWAIRKFAPDTLVLRASSNHQNGAPKDRGPTQDVESLLVRLDLHTRRLRGIWCRG